ncbi:LpxL/LpxP family Kdo(2)-lipid IV(A) lauroyl/palmitoleoyl acyltransferase [Motilimonas sp. KMU-193]|uniref:LpxL/LpxP family Kdo(2)-lipid IV(A) lauroyl/palmitoleoyl acyltransferase n=1 Tax=Motilimonas sp. KMU-193 TaxID=3388668 RepID=UPI00396B31A7
MSQPQLTSQFAHPKYWGVWLGIAAMFLISLLPYRLQLWLGKQLGRLAMKLMKSRYKVAKRNLELCFPDMPEQERNALLVKNFENTGIALFEICMAWFWPDWRVRRHFVVEGQEHLFSALNSGKGVILIGAHFLTLEMNGRIGGMVHPGIGIYRKHNNPLQDYWFYWGRTRALKNLLDRSDFRGMVRALRQGEVIWYAPDHDYGRRRCAFVPFFAVEKAATVTGTASLAKTKDTVVIPSFAQRLSHGQGYKMIFKAPLENYPTGDDIADAATINQQIEKMVLTAPEQYMWLHRRFKTRPEGEPSLYKK